MITLANNLNREIYDVHFVVLSDGPIRSWLNTNIPVHVIGTKRVRSGFIKLYKTLKSLEPDVMISSIIHMNTALLLLKPFFPGTKLIVRESSLPSALIRKYGVKGRFSKYIYKFLYHFADTVISPSSVIIEQFRTRLRLNMKNHKILYNPVDTEQIEKHISPAFTLDPNQQETVRFICTGRLTFEKGFGRLIEHLKHLDMSPYNWRVDILGEGEERRNLEWLIREHGLGNNVFLCGYTHNPWDVIARADCLLLPSLWEGMPNVVLESLLCGTPVIAMQQAGGIVDIQNYTSGNAVQTAQTMKEFMALMKTVKPLAKTHKAESLLPDVFLLPQVMHEFKEILGDQSSLKMLPNCLVNKKAA